MNRIFFPFPGRASLAETLLRILSVRFSWPHYFTVQYHPQNNIILGKNSNYGLTLDKCLGEKGIPVLITFQLEILLLFLKGGNVIMWISVLKTFILEGGYKWRCFGTSAVYYTVAQIKWQSLKQTETSAIGTPKWTDGRGENGRQRKLEQKPHQVLWSVKNADNATAQYELINMPFQLHYKWCFCYLLGKT